MDSAQSSGVIDADALGKKPRKSQNYLEKYLGGPKRVMALDIARGMAILGMFTAHLLNMPPMGFPANLINLVHGRSSILFAILAGISVGIISGMDRPKVGVELVQARIRIMVRAVLLLGWVALLSLVNMGIALILGFYGVWFILALPFLSWSVRRLLIASGVIALCGPVLRLIFSTVLSSPQGMGSEDGAWLSYFTLGHYPALIWMAFILLGLALARAGITRRDVQRRMLVAGLVMMLGGYGISTGILSALDGRLTIDFISGFTGVSKMYEKGGVKGSKNIDEGGTSGDVADPVSPVTSPPTSGATPSKDPYMQPTVFPQYAGDLAGKPVPENCYCTPAKIVEQMKSEGMPEAQPTSPGLWERITSAVPYMGRALASASPHSGTTFEVVGSAGFSLVVIALLLMAPTWIGLVLSPIAAVGSMSLTIYSAHVPYVSAMIPMQLPATISITALVAVAITFAVLWRTFIGRGPLEWVMNRVSHKAAAIRD
ncbi:MAG: heparan-alpha-glucosaminide N-acetyltransferase domain-containing protein [Actinomycetaceae bacterium]|nr:heparan-alpha-glucosaminide N-acetyltransferase domain-containing protein [Actinomycetaceae bacterium]